MKKTYCFNLKPLLFLLVVLAAKHMNAQTLNNWTWMGRDDTINQVSIYGTMGVPSTANKPGGRNAAATWTDAQGNLWLYGGEGNTAAGNGRLNDLWKYTPATKEWVWLKGWTGHSVNAVYGVRGVAAATNTPGSREGAMTWTDTLGNLWLFGGSGFTSGHAGLMNDLWKYSITTNQWTWMHGDSVVNYAGNYGTQGVSSPTNKPGSRDYGNAWLDKQGNMWLFGGSGVNTDYNDLWKYNPQLNEWTWIKSGSWMGVYGIPGVPSASNFPGRRWRACSWVDSTGNFWLFGGWGVNSTQQAVLNDMWKYNPVTGQWTWMKGSSSGNSAPGYVYGTKGVASPANTPGIRFNSVGWTDKRGNLWLFGGWGTGTAPNWYARMNDLWMYETTTNEWVWVKGESFGGSTGTYGIQGFATQFNEPPARIQGATWTDTAGNFWLMGGATDYPGNNNQFNDLWRFEPKYEYNRLFFTFYLDQNSNGTQEPTEHPFNRVDATITHSSGNVIYANSSGGIFNMMVDTGTFVTTPVLRLPYYNVAPPSHTTSFANYYNTDTFSIGLQPIPGFKDVTISITPLIGVRVGRDVGYRIICRNVGTDTVSGSFSLIKDSKLIYQWATQAPASISATTDTISWNYVNLAPFDSVSVVVVLKGKWPPALNLWDTVINIAIANYLPGESNTEDNYASVTQFALSSCDPNDKSEAHAGKISAAKVAAGDYLTYTIHFQNTGNDTAFYIAIRDTLDSKLNWSTFEMLGASHNYQVTMNDGKCIWTFDNINLVDSIHNEPLSHGYVTYRIKPRNTVQVGDVITNKAAIYFDYNLPVNTNTENTTVVADVLPVKLLTFMAKRDGKVNKLNWSTSNEVSVDRFEIERSTNGGEYNSIGVVRAGSNSYTFTDNAPLTRNYYRLKMIDKDGSFTYSPIRVVNNSGSFYVSVYPNPVNDKLQVNIESDKKATLQMQVLTQDGKAVLSATWSVNEGSAIKTINTSTLQSGSYFLRITSADKERSVVKFNKL